MKNYLLCLFFLIFVTESLAQNGEIISTIHKAVVNDISIIMEGVNTSYVALDPKSDERDFQYLERSKKGEIPDITPSQVESYYNHISKPVRQTPITHYEFISNKLHQRRILHVPAGFLNPKQMLIDTVIRGDSDTVFITFHSENKVVVHDFYNIKRIEQCNSTIDPLFFAYPLYSLNDISNVTVRDEQGLLKMTYVNTNPKDYIQYIEALLDPQKSYCATKVLVKFIIFNDQRLVIYSENNGINNESNIYFPRSFNSYYFTEANHSKPYNSAKWEGKGPTLFIQYEPGFFRQVENLGGINLPAHRRNDLVLNVKSLRLNTIVNEKQFWPSVPENYQYMDSRERNKSRIVDYKNVSNDEQKLVSGVGPFEILK